MNNNSQKGQINNSIWIFGKHPVYNSLKAKKREIYHIFVTKNNVSALREFLKSNSLVNYAQKIKIVENSFIASRVGQDQNHQGITINCSQLPMKSENALISEIESLIQNNEKAPNLLILDQITDPHNLGAIIRSAKSFGIDKIILPENNCAKESGAMLKSAAGTADLVNLFLVTNINKLLEKLKTLDYWCFGLAGEAKSEISTMKEYKNVVLIVGSEGSGIRPLVKKNCDMLVKINIDKEVESLNASVACSIALYELSKH